MADVQIGDQLIGPDGKPTLVTGVYPQEKEVIYLLSLEDGREIKSSGSHLWEVVYNNRKTIVDTYELFNALNVTHGADEYLLPFGLPAYSSQRDMGLNIESIGHCLMGAIDDNVLGTDEKLFFEKINNGRGYLERRISTNFESWSVSDRISLARGLISCSGVISREEKKGKAYFFSKGMACDFQRLIWSLGGLAHVKYESNAPGHHVVLFDMQHIELLFSSKQLDRAGHFLGKSKGIKIASVKRLERKEHTQCIKVDNPRSLFMAGDYVLTHNTETLVSIAYNALAMGSGFFYIDPKGAPKLVAQIYNMSRYLGRDHDFSAMSYSMQQKNKNPRHPRKVANTNNPFAQGSSDALSQLLVALIPPAEGSNAVFANKAQSCIIALMRGLVELRDIGEIELSINTVREHMNASKYVELGMDPRLSPATRAAVQGFLRSANWAGPEQEVDKQRAFQEQFGYAISYFSLAMANLTDTYGHIYLNDFGEVDMFDVIRNRRILVVILPSLEMAPEQLKSVGQITLSAVRNSCAVGLGDKLVGEIADVLGALPVDSPTPFLSITDEYAAIPTPGYAEVLTQGRGLGISAIVASQDFGGIKGGDEKGAKQIVANTKVKLAMKMEDSEDTWQLFKNIAAEGSVSKLERYSMDQNLGLSYKEDHQSISSSPVARLNIRDLQSQIEGEFHAFFNGDIVRGRSFYAAPPLEDHHQIRINERLGISSPDKTELSKLYGDVKRIASNINRIIEDQGVKPIVPLKTKQVEIFKAINEVPESGAKFSKNDLAICMVLSIKDMFSSAIGSIDDLDDMEESSEKDSALNSVEPLDIEKENPLETMKKKKSLARRLSLAPEAGDFKLDKEVLNSKEYRDFKRKEIFKAINGSEQGADAIEDYPHLKDGVRETMIDAERKVAGRGQKESEEVVDNFIGKTVEKVGNYAEPSPVKVDEVDKKKVFKAADDLVDSLLSG